MSEIDVSECKFYSKVDSCCHFQGNPLTASPCGYNSDCYFKQFQQEQQNVQHLKIALDGVLKENEELKTQLQQYIDLCKQKTVDIFEMDKEIKEAKAKLEKIKAIAEKNISNNQCNRCDGVSIDGGCKDKDCATYQIEQILQIIES